MTPVLHIHAQTRWHASATIIGNRMALEELRDALTRVLKSGEQEDVPAFVADGEGYHVAIRLRNTDLGDPEWNNRRAPYTDEMARNHDPDAEI